MTMRFVSVLAVALAAGSAFADKSTVNISSNGLLGGTGSHGGGSTSDFPGLSTGFEGVDGYVVGPMPQVGWSTLNGLNATLGNGASISAVNPFAGQQHLRLGKDPAFGLGTPSGVQTPALGFGGALQTTSFKIYIPSDPVNGPAYADYHVAGFTTAASLSFAWHLDFAFTGVLQVVRSAGDGGTVAGPNFLYNQWADLSVAYNPTTNAMSVTYNGNNFYNGVGGFGSVGQTAMDVAAIYSDNYQLAGEFTDIDNVSVVPAPGAMALLGLGGVLAARRRRN